MSQEHYHLSDVFKASTNSAGSCVVKFWAGVSLKVTSTVELKKTKRMAAKAGGTNSSNRTGSYYEYMGRPINLTAHREDGRARSLDKQIKA